MKTNDRTGRAIRTPALLIGWVLIALAPPASADLLQRYLDETQALGPEPTDQVRQCSVEIPEAGRFVVYLSRALSAGQVSFHILGPVGETVQQIPAQQESGFDCIELAAEQAGTFQVIAQAKEAIGQWRVLVCKAPAAEEMRPLLIRAVIMLVIAVLAVGVCRVVSKAGFGWFLAGAGVLVAAFFAQQLVANAFHPKVLGALQSGLPGWGLVTLGTLYLAATAALCGVGVVYLAARTWPALARTAMRALAIGVGGASLKTIYLGLPMLLQYRYLTSDQQGAASTAVQILLVWSPTKLIALTGVVEPLMDVFCYTAACALALLSVAWWRGRLFWGGVLLMMGINLLGGYLAMTQLAGRISLWWMELFVLPFALISLAILRWCLARWPAVPTEITTQEQPPEPAETSDGQSDDLSPNPPTTSES